MSSNRNKTNWNSRLKRYSGVSHLTYTVVSSNLGNLQFLYTSFPIHFNTVTFLRYSQGLTQYLSAPHIDYSSNCLNWSFIFHIQEYNFKACAFLREKCLSHTVSFPNGWFSQYSDDVSRHFRPANQIANTGNIHCEKTIQMYWYDCNVL